MFSSSKEPFARFLAIWAPTEELFIPSSPRPDLMNIDKDILRASLGRMEGKEEIKQHHRALFESTVGQKLTELVSQEAVATLELQRREASWQKVEALVAGADRTIESAENEAEVIDWDGWDRAQSFAYFGGSAALIYVGIRSIAMLLEGTGLPMFEEEDVANRYLFSLLTLVGLGLNVKGARGLFKTDAGRTNFAWLVTIIAVTASICWSYLFAVNYGNGFSAEVPPLVSDIKESSGHGGIALTFFALIGEAFGAAALWIFGSMLMEKHRRIPRIPKPEFVEFEARLDLLDREIAYLRDLSSRLRGRIKVIKSATDVFVGRAVARFEMAIQGAMRAEMADKDLASTMDSPDLSALEERLVNPVRGIVLTDEDDQQQTDQTEPFNGNGRHHDFNNQNGAL